MNKGTSRLITMLFILASLAIFTGARYPEAGPPAEKTKTNWISLTEAVSQFNKEKRPILIDLYTDWCGWCKVMDRKTYSNRQVAEYLGKKFYTVKFNAEQRGSLQWKGRTYSFNPQYRAHEFAVYLTNGRLSFPTTVILPEDGSPPQAIPGYLEPKDFELIVKYFGEGHYGKVAFAQYQKNFHPSW